MPKNEEIVLELKKIFDPDVHYNIYDLGLIYDIEIDSKLKIVVVKMTFTTPACPSAPQLLQSIKEVGNKFNCVVEPQVVWDPPWSVDMIAEYIRDEMGI